MNWLDLRWQIIVFGKRMSERFWMWLAYQLPKSLVLWASIRLAASVTSGKYGNTVVPELKMVDALQRWEKL